MTQGNLIQLKIDRSLSYTIDKQLDTELGQDIQLNKNQWQSVFDIVKNDNATEKQQYRGKGEDINNGKDFRDDQNQVYSFTRNAWNAILEIARGSIKKEEKTETPQEENVQTPTSDKEVKMGTEKEAYEYEATVLDILKKANIDTSDIEVNDVIQKYKNIVEYNKANNIEVDEAKLTERIENYAKGLKFAKVEAEFANAWSDGSEVDTKLKNNAVKEAVANGDMNAFKAAFHQSAKEYIELYDNTEGDGKIDVNELIRAEARELGRALTNDEIKIIQQEAINRDTILDQNNDNVLDENEIAAYMWAMSKINDGQDKKTADDITFDEWKTSQTSMGIFSGLKQWTENDQTKTMQAYPILGKIQANEQGIKLEDLYGADLNKFEFLNTEERSQLKEGLEILEREGFTPKMIDDYGKFDAALKNGYEGLR